MSIWIQVSITYKNSYNSPIGSVHDLKCIYSSRRFQRTLPYAASFHDLKCIYSSRRFQRTLPYAASFHIDKDIAKTTRSGVLEFKESYNYTVYRNYCNLFNLATICSVR